MRIIETDGVYVALHSLTFLDSVVCGKGAQATVELDTNINEKKRYGPAKHLMDDLKAKHF